MKRDNVAFLVGGLFYGVLIGFGGFYVLEHRPEAPTASGPAAVPAPAGPAAPTQIAAAQPAAAPMVDEIAALKQHLREHADDLGVLTRLANLYHDAGMWQQAVDYYARAIEVEPSDPNLLTDKGVCHQELGEYEEALALFDRAQEADPTHWQSLYNTVVVAGFSLGRLDRAQAALDKLQTVRPDAPGLDRLRQGIEHAREMAAREAPS